MHTYRHYMHACTVRLHLQVHYALLGGDSVTDEDGIVRKGISDDEWRAIRTRNLLSRDEIARLRAYAGFKPFLPVGWALAEVKAGLLGIDATAAAGTSLGKDLAAREVFSAFRDVAFKFRTESSSTFALLNAPVPFAYFHVMKLLMVLSLLLISCVTRRGTSLRTTALLLSSPPLLSTVNPSL